MYIQGERGLRRAPVDRTVLSVFHLELPVREGRRERREREREKEERDSEKTERESQERERKRDERKKGRKREREKERKRKRVCVRACLSCVCECVDVVYPGTRLGTRNERTAASKCIHKSDTNSRTTHKKWRPAAAVGASLTQLPGLMPMAMASIKNLGGRKMRFRSGMFHSVS